MTELNFEQACESVFLRLRHEMEENYTDSESRIPSQEDLLSAIETESSINKLLKKEPFSEDLKEKIKKELESRMVIQMEVGKQIIDQNTYVDWLKGRKPDIDEYYWNRYKRLLLETKSWSPAVVDTLDRVGDDILNLLGDPLEKGEWHRKGLVLGDVQSGKTSTYLALINKSVDAGYKLVILLTGTLESLRVQTQERIDEGFAGINSENALIRDQKKKYIGVGKLDRKRKACSLTDTISDFNIKKLQSNHFDPRAYEEPLILVIKKNTSILKHLQKWITTSYTDQESEIIDVPLLLIDDEADNASVNTKKEDTDPTAINTAIRNILAAFQHTTYVAVTATPFANIFINPSSEEELEDLFPSDFIYALSPPDNYIGSQALFAEDAVHEDAIELIDDGDILASKDKKEHQVPYLPQSLKKALKYFFLCNAIRDSRGKTIDHRSMLVNVNPFTAPQEQVFDLLEQEVFRLNNDIKAYGKKAYSQAILNPSIAGFADIWEEYAFSSLCSVSFQEILPKLSASVSKIEVTMINMRTKAKGLERLDYSKRAKQGYRVVAVGGNSLSRGITLEGLCVSYFYRSSKMYDTLLQMGRWFGYRPGYEDLFRLWMGEQTKEWFEFIHRACSELRSEIAYMNKAQKTPKEFGLKVLNAPDSLMITAPNKMRTAKSYEQVVSMSGRLVETPRLMKKSNGTNLQLIEHFFKEIATCKVAKTEDKPELYQGVDHEIISDLLREFITHPSYLVFDGRQIAKYIEDNRFALKPWTVYVATGSLEPQVVAGISVMPTVRKMTIDEDCIRISGSKSRVGSTGATKILLTAEQQQEAKKAFSEEPKSGKSGDTSRITVPDYVYLRYAENPILIVYFMQCNQKQGDLKASPSEKEAFEQLGDEMVVGLSLGFPVLHGDKEKKISYKINSIKYQQYFDSYLEGDEDDED